MDHMLIRGVGNSNYDQSLITNKAFKTELVVQGTMVVPNGK